MAEELLAVGGDYDGQLLSINNNHDFVAYPEKAGISYEKSTEAATQESKNCIYRRMDFHGENKRYRFLVPEGFTANDLIEKLIDGYKP